MFSEGCIKVVLFPIIASLCFITPMSLFLFAVSNSPHLIDAPSDKLILGSSSMKVAIKFYYITSQPEDSCQRKTDIPRMCITFLTAHQPIYTHICIVP